MSRRESLLRRAAAAPAQLLRFRPSQRSEINSSSGDSEPAESERPEIPSEVDSAEPPAVDAPAAARPTAAFSAALRRTRAALPSRRTMGWSAAGAAALAGGTAAALLFLPAFTVDEIEVRGGEGEDVERIVSRYEGRNLFRLNAGELAAELAALPRVESARVTRAFPDSVAIKVAEREPFLAVRGEDGFIMVDDHGVAFASDTADSAAPWSVAIESVADAEAAAGPLLGILRELPPGIADEVETVQVTAYGAATFTLTGERTIRWGDDSENEIKSRVSLALLEEGHRKVDVSAPRAPTVSRR
ncbi:cell division protein FtsQ/DivIB [Salininema proteolyticum]|uniref:Cell division protein FtsQ/DivIB n=1 Tax=Salininema proteolyticum TaxID=1607685 RepID=A0ABV8TYM2_9ACTN